MGGGYWVDPAGLHVIIDLYGYEGFGTTTGLGLRRVWITVIPFYLSCGVPSLVPLCLNALGTMLSVGPLSRSDIILKRTIPCWYFHLLPLA